MISRLFVLLPLVLSACATPAPRDPPLAVATVAPGSTEPIRFGDFGLREMRRGTEIGRYVWGIDCAGPYDSIHWTTGRGVTPGGGVEQRFRDVLERAGFDVAGAGAGDFDRRTDAKRARFVVSAELRSADLTLCRRTHWLTGAKRGESGEGSIAIDWSVHAAEDGRLVHRVATRGTATLPDGVPEGDALLLEDAFANAAGALAADPGFRAAVGLGGMRVSGVPGDPEGAAVAVVTPGPAFGPPGGRQQETVTAAIVQVGAGRGVVIGEGGGQSYLVTPLAAAGPDDTVTVRPARGVALDGVVTARDGQNGLALVRVPARLTALPVREDAAEVSEPVQAATEGGRSRRLGIVAGMPGDGMALGQADLSGAPPAAGDPLLDESGNLVGILLAAPPFGEPARHGLTPFVPVAEACRRLGVAVTALGTGGTHRLDRTPAPPT